MSEWEKPETWEKFMKGKYEMFGVVGSLLKPTLPFLTAAPAHPARGVPVQVTSKCCSSFLCFHTGLAMVIWVFQQLPQLWGSTTRKSGSSKSSRHSQEYLLWLFKIQVSGLCPWTFELAEMLTSDSLGEGVTGDPPFTDYHTPHLLPPPLCADRALIFLLYLVTDMLICGVQSLYTETSPFLGWKYCF